MSRLCLNLDIHHFLMFSYDGQTVDLAFHIFLPLVLPEL